MNHKRKRPKARRAGCLLCKPHKFTGAQKAKYRAMEKSPGTRHAARYAV